MDGIILVNKEKDMTSRDVVNKMKKRVILLDKGTLKKDYAKGTYDKNEKC